MSKIIGTDTMEDVLVKLTEGNPGALKVCLELYTQHPKIDPRAAMPGMHPLLRLDDMGIYGSEIWMLYKDVCNCNIVYLLTLLRANQLGHVGKSHIKLAIKGTYDFDFESMLENTRKVVSDFASEASLRKGKFRQN